MLSISKFTILILSFFLINQTLASEKVGNTKDFLKSLTKRSLNKNETAQFINDYAITLQDERRDGVVTYIFDQDSYKRYKNGKVISEDGWRFSKLGALRLFSGDIHFPLPINVLENPLSFQLYNLF